MSFLETVLLIHGRLSTTALLFSLIMMVWSFWAYFRREDLGSSYWGAAVICELIFVAQMILGVLMILSGIPVIRWVHILYGVLGLISIPAVYAFTRGRNSYREALLYALTMAFLIGVVLRAQVSAYALGG